MIRISSPSRLASAALVCALFTPHAHAVSKETIQLQTQVQQLIDSVARLQQSNDERMGVMRDLLQQTVDSVNKMSVTVASLQTKMQAQGDAQAARNDQISGQVQALNDSMDELRARIQRMEKTLTDLQGQAQSTNAMLGNLPGANGAGAAAPAGTAPSAPVTPAAAPASPGRATATDANGAASPNTGGLATAPAPLVNSNAATPAGPSATDMYRSAYTDYMAGKYPVAASEFNDLVKAYPDDNLSGNALFYLGEIDRRGDKPSAAVRSYDRLLERYPDNTKIPAAHLHKGEALIALRQNEAGARELRTLLQRFPNSPEAAQARTRLSALERPGSRR